MQTARLPLLRQFQREPRGRVRREKLFLLSLCAILTFLKIVATFFSSLLSMHTYSAGMDAPPGELLAEQENDFKSPGEEVDAPCTGSRACISIHVFAFNRAESTRQLLEALESSDYAGYDQALPLVVHVDGPLVSAGASDASAAHASILTLVKNSLWTHGPKFVDVQDTNIGLKDSWLSAWPNPRPNDLMIAFEDDVVLSPLYFQWLLKILTEYNLQADSRDPSLLGISLSPMRVDEISYPFRPWMTHKKISADKKLFLHSVPSSWGVAYFGGPWRDFLSFTEVRSKPPFYDVDEAGLNLTGYGYHTKRGDPNLWLPNSRTDNWVKSWKRFMVEFAFGRGAYTLYPNIADSRGLATSTFMQGEHVPEGASKNPRTAPLAQAEDIALDEPLPAYKKLVLVDMHGEYISRRNLSYRGDAFISQVASLGDHYSTLTALWRRPCLVDVAILEGKSKSNDRSPFVRYQGGPGQDERYLLVEPQMGFSNQLTAIEHSVLWAHTLGRKLVLPHLFWPRASSENMEKASWIPFHQVFDPSGAAKLLSGLKLVHADAGMLAKTRPERVLEFELKPMFDHLQEVYSDSFAWSDVPRVAMHSYRPNLDSADKLYQNLGSCEDKVMVLDGLYKDPFGTSLSDTFRGQLWTSLFRPSPLVEHMIQKVRQVITSSTPNDDTANLATFGCMHVRLGDFSSVCSAPPKTARWLKDLYAAGFHCNVSSNAIIDRASSMDVNKLLVISDDLQELAPILAKIRQKRQLRVLKSVSIDNDDPGLWSGLNIRKVVAENLPPLHPNPSKHFVDVVAAITEQEVCASADLVVLNAFSTFSRSMSYRRGRREGVEYW